MPFPLSFADTVPTGRHLTCLRSHTLPPPGGAGLSVGLFVGGRAFEEAVIAGVWAALTGSEVICITLS